MVAEGEGRWWKVVGAEGSAAEVDEEGGSGEKAPEEERHRDE